MIAAALDQWRNYFTGPTWTTAFEFLERLPSDAPDGLDDAARRFQHPKRGIVLLRKTGGAYGNDGGHGMPFLAQREV